MRVSDSNPGQTERIQQETGLIASDSLLNKTTKETHHRQATTRSRMRTSTTTVALQPTRMRPHPLALTVTGIASILLATKTPLAQNLHPRPISAMPVSHAAAVDAYTFPHLHPASRPNSRALDNALRASSAAGLPPYMLAPAQGKFLALHCRAANVTHALEVGTLGGYSAIWLTSENPQLHLTSVEYDRHHVDVARKNIERAGLSDRVEVVQGRGVDVLARLGDEVRRGGRPRFGFVFIDADKPNNWTYLKMAKGLVKPGSVICVDNIVGRHGELVERGTRDPDVVGSRTAVERAGKEAGVDAVVLQTVTEKSSDGWLWAVVTDPGDEAGHSEL